MLIRQKKYRVFPLVIVHDSIEGEYDPNKINHEDLEYELKNLMIEGPLKILKDTFWVDVEELFSVDLGVFIGQSFQKDLVYQKSRRFGN